MNTPVEYLIQLRDSSEGWEMEVKHLTPGLGTVSENGHPRAQRTYSSPGKAALSAVSLIAEVVAGRGGKRKGAR